LKADWQLKAQFIPTHEYLIQDGLHIGNDLVLVAALGTDANGDKHRSAWTRGRPKKPR
jgi:hypothetical protein